MTALELGSIIDSQRNAADERQTMERDALGGVRFLPGFATIVKGIRRCGKSTLADQWRQKSPEMTLALNFDDLRMLSFSTADFAVLDRVIEERHPATLIFDEIHTIPGWELYARQKLDENYKVLVTGSNATLMSRELGTKLSGRHIDLEIAPFSYREFLRFKQLLPGLESLKSYIRQGGFPGYLKTGDPEVLRQLVEDIIYKDIAVRHGIRDTRPLRDLCAFLLGAVGNRISPSRLKEAMHVKSASTLLEYFNYFEDAYLVERLECYSESSKARLLAPKKIYVADTALADAVGTSSSPNWGHLLENVIYRHLKLRYSELYYLSDGDNRECDFVGRKGRNDPFAAIQVSWELTDENRDREFDGLVMALKRFNLESGIIVTADTTDFAVKDGCSIEILPAWKFLDR